MEKFADDTQFTIIIEYIIKNIPHLSCIFLNRSHSYDIIKSDCMEMTIRVTEPYLKKSISDVNNKI